MVADVVDGPGGFGEALTRERVREDAPCRERADAVVGDPARLVGKDVEDVVRADVGLPPAADV